MRVTRSIAHRLGAQRAAILLRDEGRLLDHFARTSRTSFDGEVLEWDGNSLGLPLRTSHATFRLLGDRVELSVEFAGLRAARALQLKDDIVRILDDALAERFGRPCGDKDRQVFCIGFQRTGTTSLSEALRMLGYFSLHDAPWLLPDLRDGVRPIPLLDEYDAFTDNPFPLMYEELDRDRPGSKFVLTVRDVDSWLHSVSFLVEEWAPGFEMESFIYGVDHFDRDVYRQRYVEHNEAVIRHFAGRPDALLVIDVTRGDPWPALCEFLGEPIPRGEFPRSGRSAAASRRPA